MGWYGARVLPRVLDRVMAGEMFARRRQEVCAGLAGDVVEIGFGSGLNVPHYPAAVRSVAAVEPLDAAFARAAERIAASPVAVERAGHDAQRLDGLADGRFDCAVTTWTLCTIPDPLAALREVHRVLGPGAPLHFVEHGLSPDGDVERWQHRLEPLQRRLVGGCHLTRDVPALLVAAGFVVEDVQTSYERPRPFGYMFQGVARAGE